MFGFGSNSLKQRKREEVQRMLLARTNRAQLGALGANNRRKGTRAALTEVVWMIPSSAYRNADFAQALPAISKDVSPQGISFIHPAEVTDPNVIVGLAQESGDRRFLLCSLKHCTPLLDGFYHVGLLADEVIGIEQRDEDAMRQAIEQRIAAGKKQTATRVRVVG